MVESHELKWLLGCDLLSRIFSTCSKRQYFSVILGENKRLISQGYNGSPPGYPHCNEGYCPRAQENSPSGSAYDNCIANHAEANALLWADPRSRQGATLIVNGPPCFSCAKLICSSGISRVIGYTDKNYAQIADVEKFFKDNSVNLVLVERQGELADSIEKYFSDKNHTNILLTTKNVNITDTIEIPYQV